MPTEAESFLATEEAVSKLLDNLESLKKEMEVYKTGRIQLEEQLKDLKGFTEQIKTLAETSHDVLGALGRIGTPEILERTTELGNLVRPMLGKFEDTAAKNLESIAGVEAASKKTGADLLARIELLESNTAESLIKSEGLMGDKLAAIQSLLHAGNAEVKSGLRKYVKRLTILSIITPAVATIIIIMVYLVFGK